MFGFLLIKLSAFFDENVFTLFAILICTTTSFIFAVFSFPSRKIKKNLTTTLCVYRTHCLSLSVLILHFTPTKKGENRSLPISTLQNVFRNVPKLPLPLFRCKYTRRKLTSVAQDVARSFYVNPVKKSLLSGWCNALCLNNRCQRPVWSLAPV